MVTPRLNSRRQFVGGVAGLAGLLSLPVIADGNAAAQSANPDASPVPASSGDWTEPVWSPDPPSFTVLDRNDDTVTVETELDGVLEFPANPQRIVCMYGGEDRFIALGLGDRVISIASMDGQNPFFTTQEDFDRYLTNPDMYIAPNNGQPDLERLIELKVDLIMGPSYLITDEYYATLSAIAPTLRSSQQSALRGSLRSWGAYFGLDDLAESRIANLDDYVARARTEIAPVVGEQKVGVVYYFSPEWQYAVLGWDTDAEGRTILTNPYGAPFYQELGLRPTDFVENMADEMGRENMQVAGLLALSPELLGQIDADFLFMVATGENARGVVQQLLETDPIIQGIPAVQKNQAFVLTTDEFSGGYLATYRAVQLAVSIFTNRPLI